MRNILEEQNAFHFQNLTMKPQLSDLDIILKNHCKTKHGCPWNIFFFDHQRQIGPNPRRELQSYEQHTPLPKRKTMTKTLIGLHQGR